MPKMTVDGVEVEFQAGMTLMQVCEIAGAEIPRFCYHEKLSIAGNCRMCLVELEKAPKPVASCAMPASEGMVVHTKTQNVKKAREGVMEFLLINHPLDCPICDQGGECDLQDQAMHYGKGESRYKENKRSVEDKDFGPLIKTHMTRCIHCTRCIRFSEDVAGVEELGAVYRGENMEVGTYVEKAVSSEMSGNIIDLCPVGALTSKPYAFKARSWELTKTQSIDIMDAVGSNIRIDARGVNVMRILPITNDDINEEWISDRSRFFYDGLQVQRIDSAYVKKDNKLTKVSLDEALIEITNKFKKLKSDQIAAIAGDLCDVESIYSIKSLFDKIGSSNYEIRMRGEKFTNESRADYIFNPTINGIDSADFCLMVGVNLRHDAPIINSRIRKNILKNKIRMVNIGPDFDLTYKYDSLGDDLAIIDEIISGKHKICKDLKLAKNPILMVGQSISNHENGHLLLAKLKELANLYFVKDGWNGFGIVHAYASMVGGLDLGFLQKERTIEDIYKDVEEGKVKLLYLNNADELNHKRLKKAFIIYQGHHGDKMANYADVVLPSKAYSEKNSIYVNLEGRPQRARLAVSSPKEALHDAEIILKIANCLKLNLGFDTIDSMYKKLFKEFPHLANINNIISSDFSKVKKTSGKLTGKLKKIKNNFYMNNAILRSSPIMASCAKEFINTAQMETVE